MELFPGSQNDRNATLSNGAGLLLAPILKQLNISNMEKKLYYKFNPNNGEPWIIDGNLDNLKDMIQGEMDAIKKEGDEEDAELTITFVWMTDEEMEDLPDAY